MPKRRRGISLALNQKTNPSAWEHLVAKNLVSGSAQPFGQTFTGESISGYTFGAPSFAPYPRRSSGKQGGSPLNFVCRTSVSCYRSLVVGVMTVTAVHWKPVDMMHVKLCMHVPTGRDMSQFLHTNICPSPVASCGICPSTWPDNTALSVSVHLHQCYPLPLP